MKIFISLVFAGCVLAGELDTMLERAAQQAEKQVLEFNALACTERVTQLKFDEKQKVIDKHLSLYDYLILLNLDGGDLSVDESRLEQAAPKQKPAAAALVTTTGFASMMLIMHPHFQPAFHYKDLGDQVENGRHWRHLSFEHVPGKATPSILKVKEREYPISWKGEAWLDPQTGRVARIHAELLEKLDDIGLEVLSADVRYGTAESGKIRVDWAPLQAMVEVQTRHQHWKNTHEFSAYRRFEVNTAEKREAVTPQ